MSVKKTVSNVYTLNCSYFKEEFSSIEKLIEAVLLKGVDPNQEILINGEKSGEEVIDYIQF